MAPPPFPFASPIRMRALPDPAAFEDKTLVKKKQKRVLDTPIPKCPSTPLRSPYKVEKQCYTELKKARCSSENFTFVSTSRAHRYLIYLLGS